MFRVAWRNLTSHKLRLALTVLTIVLGIAFVTGTFIFTDSLKKSFNSLLEGKAPDVSVTAKSGIDIERAQRINGQTATLPEADVAKVAKIPGVRAAYPNVIVDGALILGQDGKPISDPGPPTFGQSWPADPATSSLTITKGAPPQGLGQVVLLEQSATKAGVDVGQKVRVDTPSAGTVTLDVVGLASRGVSGSVGGTLAAFSLEGAQKYLVKPGSVSDISVMVDQGQDPRVVGDRIEAAFGKKVKATTKQEATDELSSRLNSAFSFFNTFLLVFGIIALFVATFLIFNTFSMLVAQRSRELALLRAVGATRRQVRGSVLAEAVLLGLVASTLGLLAGIGVSRGLRALFGVFGAELPGGPLVIAPRTILVAYAVGVLVTVVSAMLPARRASKVPPVAALQADASVPNASLTRLSIVGGLLVLGSVPLAWVGLQNTDVAQTAATWIGLSGLGAVLGVIALSPMISRGVVNVLGAPFRRSAVGVLAVENTKRNPRRTAATASALAIGLALMTAIGVIAASAKASVTQVVDNTIGADFVVLGTNFQPFAHNIYTDLAQVSDAAMVTYVRPVPARFKPIDGGAAGTAPEPGSDSGAGDDEGGGGGPGGSVLTGVETSKFGQAVDLKFTEGSLLSLAADEIAVDTKTAAEKGLTVGETVRGTFLTGTKDLKIGGLYEPSGFFAGYIASVTTLTTIGDFPADTAIYIRAPEGSDSAAVEALRVSLEAKLAKYPAVKLQDQSQIKEEITGQFDQLFGFIYALLALAVIVAFLGIINTLSLSVFERTREIGLLRAVGSTRKQVRRMVMLESVLIAVFGAALGVVIGLVYGGLLQKVLEPQGITQLMIPTNQIVLFLVLGAVGGVVAAVLPARRASRLNTLSAIASV